MRNTHRHQLVKLALGLSVGAVWSMGCDSKPSRLDLPTYDSMAGDAALAAYDTNKDGQINGDELGNCPSLKSTMERIDTNQNGAITADEINARIQQWRTSRVALMPVCCKVLLDGKPLAKARVTFEPEAFLGNAVHPASSVSDADGITNLSVPPEFLSNPMLAGMAPGFYRIIVEVEKDGTTKKYTTGPRTGCEVASDAPWTGEGIITAEFTTR